jgi:hypothetical protein
MTCIAEKLNSKLGPYIFITPPCKHWDNVSNEMMTGSSLISASIMYQHLRVRPVASYVQKQYAQYAAASN